MAAINLEGTSHGQLDPTTEPHQQFRNILEGQHTERDIRKLKIKLVLESNYDFCIFITK